MRISILTFGAIASILTINSVLADTVVTSRGYVDTQDALKQDKITAGTTGSVVTYNGAQNGQTQFSERAIFDPETNFDYENNEVATGHEGDLVTAESIFPAVGSLYQSQTGPENTVVMYNGLGQLGGPGGSRGIYDGSTTYDADDDADKLVTAGVVNGFIGSKGPVTYKECAGVVNNECVLWNLSTREVFMNECYTNDQCPSGKWCDSGICCSGCSCPSSSC